MKPQIYPHSQENEMMVLGCAISEEYSHKVISESLTEDDFYVSPHKIIFQTLKQLFLNNNRADLHLLCLELNNTGRLEGVGGAGYLTSLAQYAGTSAHVEEYIEFIKNDSFRRKALHTLQESIYLFQEAQDPIAALETCQKKLSNVTKSYAPTDGAHIGQILSGDKSEEGPSSLIERIQERQAYFKTNNQPFLTGIPTGLPGIDDQVALLEKTNMIVLAARPSMGKTALALQIASNIAQHKFSVAFMSLEMGRDQLAERILAMQSGVPLDQIKKGDLTTANMRSLHSSYEALKALPLIIHDRNISTVSHVISRARKLKDEQDIRLLVIDYLQLIGTERASESRQYEVAEVSRRLKLLALEIEIPILCLAQLSRKVEERTDKRPLLSDLRDSGQIEQDCDIAMFMYRRDYYDPNDKPGETQLIIAKNRNGGLANISMMFHKKTGSFGCINEKSEPQVGAWDSLNSTTKWM